jgi:hypothetical protein
VPREPQKNDDQTEQAPGRNRGRFSTKIHVSVDGLGTPLRLILPPGQAGDSPQAAALIAGYDVEVLLIRLLPSRCAFPPG